MLKEQPLLLSLYNSNRPNQKNHLRLILIKFPVFSLVPLNLFVISSMNLILTVQKPQNFSIINDFAAF